MVKNHFAVDVFCRYAQLFEQCNILRKTAHKRARRTVALKATAVAARALHTVKIDDIMPDFATDAASALNEATVFDDAAANAGTDRNDKHVLLALCATKRLLAERRCVRIVDDGYRQMKPVFQNFLHRAAEPVAELCTHANNRAGVHINLPRCRNADALDFHGAFFENFSRKVRNRRHNRRFVAVKADAARFGKQNFAVFVHNADLHSRAADINA